MRKFMKRVSALILSSAFVLAMGVTAFAADMNHEAGVIGEFTAPTKPTAQADKVTIYKELKAINPSSSTVFAPAITYQYEITSQEGGAEITDAAGVKATTKTGLTGATITASVSWTTGDADKLSTSGEGVLARKPIEVDFSAVEWTGAGVYRYKVTETAPDYAASSVIEGNATHDRYLDVYVMDNGEGYAIYGYVCFTVNGPISGSSVADAKKTEGFVDTTDYPADQYYTYDLEVTKAVVNDNAMKNHDFPFSVTFTPASGVTTANIKLATDVNSDATLGNGYAGALSSDSPKLQDSGSVKYIGIPYGTAVTINETIDVAGTTYKVTTTQADTNIEGQSITGTAAGSVSNNAVVNAQTTNALAAKKVDFTNEMQLISPTGVVLRFAPYALMLGAGIILLGPSRRSRREDA